jgi:hypothetical protein
VRVRNVVTELRAFPANIAYLCHSIAPNSCGFVLPEPLSSDFITIPGLVSSPEWSFGGAERRAAPRRAEFSVYRGRLETERATRLAPPLQAGTNINARCPKSYG